jgi:Tol biopolymer transport system component
MNDRLRRHLCPVVTMGLLLLLVLGGARPGLSAPPLGVPSSGWTELASVASDGTHGDDSSSSPSISADGRHVAFASNATNLVAGDTNETSDVFVHDRQTGETTRVSVASDGTQGGFQSSSPSISAGGRYVAFSSYATNLVEGDTNGEADVFVRDRQTGETTRVSVASGGTQSESGSFRPFISADGRYVAFSSYATDLVEGDTNNKVDVFVHDRQTGDTTRVSVASDGTQGDDWSGGGGSISADGRYVAFESGATNLVEGDTNVTEDIFVRDRQTGDTTRVSVASDDTQGDGESYSPSISADGRYVAFDSEATNLVAGDTNGTVDVFVRDRQTGDTTRASVASGGTQGDGGSYFPSISALGDYVAFASEATNLVEGDSNGWPDVFVHDRQAGETIRVSVASGGTQGDSGSEHSSISGDGRYVAFESNATTLVEGDTNEAPDVFLHDPWFKVYLPLAVKSFTF